jgi:hypothetical protein
VFRAGEADARRAKRDRVLGLLGRVGIGANLELRGLGAPLHELDEVLVLLGALRGLIVVQQTGDDFGRSGLDLARINEAARTVNREEVAFAEGLSVKP